MRRIQSLFRSSALAIILLQALGVWGTPVWAADERESPVSTARAPEAQRSMLLREELVSVKPQVGAIAFTDAQNESTSRLAAGATADMNLVPFIDSTLREWYVGPVVGLFYSHLGDTDANFFGANTTAPSGLGGANLAIIPTNLKVGYAFTEFYRISAHGGGNIVYRSVANSLNLGAGSNSSDSLWKYYPNVGGDLDIAIARSVALTLRPDVTFTPGNTVFTGTLGLGIFFG
jgi:hypothetical protein